MTAGQPRERTSFGPTSGMGTGVIGLIAIAVLGGMSLVDSEGLQRWQLLAGLLLGAVAIWTFLMRPRVIFTPEVLVLRNALADIDVPYALIDEAEVLTMTRVRVGETAYSGLGVGRSARRVMRENLRHQRAKMGADEPIRLSDPGLAKVPELVEDTIRMRAAEAREVGAATGAQVVRRWAVPEVAGLVVLALALTVLLVV